MLLESLCIRIGTSADAVACQRLTRQYREWLPFVMRASLVEAAERGALGHSDQWQYHG